MNCFAFFVGSAEQSSFQLAFLLSEWQQGSHHVFYNLVAIGGMEAASS